MEKKELCKQNFIRLSMVMNSFGNNIDDILIKCIIYIIYKKQKALSFIEIQKSLEEEIGQFSDTEIRNSLEKNDEYFMITEINEENYYDITQKARVLYENKSNNFIDISIEQFINEKCLVLKKEEIRNIIFSYLYKCINEELDMFDVIIGNDVEETDAITNNKELINQYFIWANKKNDDTVYKIIMSMLDFCHLSANINKNQIKTIIGKKKFYIDANVIFRLMGINNEERQMNAKLFIEKCKEYDIELVLTSFTDKEILNAFEHYAEIITTNYKNYKGKGEINNFFEINDNEFYNIYVNNKNKKGIYSKEDFLYDLNKMYEVSTKQFKKITIPTTEVSINPALKKSYTENHNNSWELSIDTDLSNIQYIRNVRKENTNSIFDTTHYLITEDKKLIEWSKINISNFNAIATTPSQWYTIFLKLGGRAVTIKEKQSFYNFLKIDSSFRFKKINNEELKKKVAITVNNSIDNGEIQDRVFKKLQTLEVKDFRDEDKLNSIIKETTNEYVEEQKNIGYKLGIAQATEKGITKIEEELNELQLINNKLETEKPRRTKNYRVRNIIINVSLLFLFGIILFLVYKKNNNVLKVVLTILFIFLQMFSFNIFTVDIKRCEEIIDNKIKSSNEYLNNLEMIKKYKKMKEDIEEIKEK